MNIVIIKALQLLCCLSLLVVLHEGGHFGFARLFKVRVNRFYMFFNPYFHIFSTRDKWFTRLFPRFRDNETEYGLGWVPLGGYCEIDGMIDETTDQEKREKMKQPAQPHEFRAHPVWHRFFIMFGGVLMNFITAFVIYCAIMYTWGRDVVPMRSFTHGFAFNQEAQHVGFHNGDIPVAFDGEEVPYYGGHFIQQMCNAHTVTVLRDGQEVDLPMPDGGLNLLDLMEQSPAFIVPAIPARVDSVIQGTAAAGAGMQAGDRIVSVDGTQLNYWSDYDSLMQRRADILSAPGCTAQDSLDQRRMTLVFEHAGTMDTAAIQLDQHYQTGVVRASASDYSSVQHIDYDLISCIPAGISYFCDMVVSYIDQFQYLFSAKGATQVGSFITIGSIFPSAWDWHSFWSITAFISIILAVMNLLPIPGLDGGHIVILMFEAITGHEPSQRVLTVIQYIGMGIICALMLLAFGNDIMRFIVPMFH